MFHKPVKAKEERKPRSEALSQHQKSFQLGIIWDNQFSRFYTGKCQLVYPGWPIIHLARNFYAALTKCQTLCWVIYINYLINPHKIVAWKKKKCHCFIHTQINILNIFIYFYIEHWNWKKRNQCWFCGLLRAARNVQNKHIFKANTPTRSSKSLSLTLQVRLGREQLSNTNYPNGWNRGSDNRVTCPKLSRERRGKSSLNSKFLSSWSAASVSCIFSLLLIKSTRIFKNVYQPYTWKESWLGRERNLQESSSPNP